MPLKRSLYGSESQAADTYSVKEPSSSTSCQSATTETVQESLSLAKPNSDLGTVNADESETGLDSVTSHGTETNGRELSSKPKEMDGNTLYEEAFVPKDQYGDDDNEDLAFFNVNIIWPMAATLLFATFFSLTSIVIGSPKMRDPFERFKLNNLLFAYGNTYRFCFNVTPHIPSHYKSLLRQISLYVWENATFRVACGVTVALRLFFAVVIRRRSIEDTVSYSVFFRMLNEIAILMSMVDVLSLATLAYVNVRVDYPEVYLDAFRYWLMCNGVLFVCRLVQSVYLPLSDHLDLCSILLKTVSTILFFSCAPEFYKTHSLFAQLPACNPFVTWAQAMTEYAVLTAYLVFNLSMLLDVRHIRLIIYPPTCGGQCDPVMDPRNFKKGAIYESYTVKK